MKKEFPDLYKRTKTGAIQIWNITVYHTVSYLSLIEKISGQLGTTSPLEHTEEVTKGLQGRSIQQQAEAQAESDWKKKKDSGYKSLEELKITKESGEYCWHRVLGSNNASVPFYGTLPVCLEEALPQFNSDATGNVKPMLAKPWEKVKNIIYPCIIEPKLDGVRCLIVADEGEQIIALSRSGKEYITLEHIKADISAAFFNENIELPLILDGEIYSEELTFQEITAAVKKLSPNSLKLQFRAYDIVNEQKMSERTETLASIIQSISSERIVLINRHVANNKDEVEHYHNLFVQQGNEGAMLRMFEGKYEQGFRSSSLLKVKEFQDEEFELDSLEYGQRGQEDLIAVCKTSEGKVFRAKIQGSREQKIKFELQYQEWYETEVNFKFSVKFFGWTTDKLPRFPIGKGLREVGT